MNTIKIYLAESGRIADVHKDFPLYQGQFQDKLLNVYVPTSILAPSFEIQHYIGQMSGAAAPTTDQLNGFVIANTYPSRSPENGDVIEFYNSDTQKFFVYTFSTTWGSTEVDSFGTLTTLAGTSIKIGMLATKSNGVEYKSKSYFMRYLKTLTYNNIEYALYERKLPKEFTKFAGQGLNAPILVANVVNIDSSDNTVLSIITSQTCSLDVMKSTMHDQDEAIEPSDLELLEAEINTLSADMALKQDKIDNGLDTTTKSVVGAINTINSQTQTNTSNISTNTLDISDIKAEQITQNSNIGTNTTNIATNTGDIASLKSRVSTIENTMTTGENYIGTMTGSSLPTNAQLNSYVETEAGRAPKNGDVVIFTLQVSQGTDKNYKYIYGLSGWTNYEIPPAEKADNNTYGIVKGSYNNTTSPAVQVDISGGEISSIYVVDGNNTKRTINEYLNTDHATLTSTVSQVSTNTANISSLGNRTTTIENNYSKIISGETEVGAAKKAEQDGVGNNIVATYLTQNAGVTKQQMKDYALPREFNDVSFLTADGFSSEVPETNDPIISVTTTSTQDALVFSAEKTFSNVEFELTQKNSYSDFIMMAASSNCTASFILTTQWFNEDTNAWVTLNVEMSSPVTFTANTIQKITFTSTLNYIYQLHLNVINIGDGSKIRQRLSIVPESSAETTFDVYSNATYPSQFFLNTTAMTVLVAQGYLGQIRNVAITGDTDEDGLFFQYPTNQTLHNDVLYRFTLTYADSIDEGTAVRFTGSTASYYDLQIVTPYNYGTANPARLADFRQVSKTNANGYNTITFEAIYNNQKFNVITDDLKAAYYNKSVESTVANTNTVDWESKTWSGLSDFTGAYVWADGENIYYSNNTSHYQLDKVTSTWKEKTWTGLTQFYGNNVWSSGRNIYYSYGSIQYVLNIGSSTWSQKTWNVSGGFYRQRIWSDGINTYLSGNTASTQYRLVLNSGSEIWQPITWSGLETADLDDIASNVWSDGQDVYLGLTKKLIKGTTTWVPVAFTGLSSITGKYVWSDGYNTYYDSYRLDKENRNWVDIDWKYTISNSQAENIWSDGDNIYYSGLSNYVLRQAKTVRPAIKNGSEVNKNTAIYASINEKVNPSQLQALADSTVSVNAQILTDAQKAQARTNIGAGTSSFDGAYTSLTSKPILDTSSGLALSTNNNETITGTVSLHKISKTGTLADAIEDANHRVVTDTEKSTWNGYGTDISTIEGKIPSAATTSNQLADKAFVNSSINALAAYYITKNANGDPFATKAELTGASTYYSGGVARTPTTNDYCIVIADISQATTVTDYTTFTNTNQYVNYHVLYNNEDVLVTHDNKDSVGITAGTTPCYYSIPTTRYSYQGSQWEFQYIVNDTALTAAQIEAINSGITAQLVAAIPSTYVSSVNGSSGAVTGIEVTANKVTSVSNASTDDEYPTAKCLYDLVGDINTILTQLNSGTGV